MSRLRTSSRSLGHFTALRVIFLPRGGLRMGLKADTSFLRFVSMGAVGALSVKSHLEGLGFQPIELERYCTSNKIWQTKVKRLRLPDLLCVRTGIRFEVRGKSALAIKMSHAEKNPDRAWDAGLRDQDIVAFVRVEEQADASFVAPNPPVCFSVGDLRRSVHLAKLGPPKSASEGAERDLTWPAIVPKKDGVVTYVDDCRLKILKFGEAHPKYTYQLKEKTPYVQVDDEFKGQVTVLASAIENLLNPAALVGQGWDPLGLLNSSHPIDRYAAVKSFPFTCGVDASVERSLECLATEDPDVRVRLEAAGSLASLGRERGFDLIETAITSPERWGNDRLSSDALQMEVALILSEIGSRQRSSKEARDLLRGIADGGSLQNEEVRQAAVWGLGRGGCGAYESLIEFLDDPDDRVSLHAICAFGSDLGEAVVEALVDLLVSGSEREQASASEVLSRNAGSGVVRRLLQQSEVETSDWVLATLGRLPPDLLPISLLGERLAFALAPIQRLHYANWLAEEEQRKAVRFLATQTIGCPT